MSEIQNNEREQLEQLLSYIEDLMANEDYEKAQEMVHNALSLETFDIRVYQRYAFILRMLDNSEAAPLFEAAVMNPGDAEAFYKIARSLMGDQLYRSAINPLKKVVEMVPMAANVNFELAYAYMKEFQLEDARTYFATAFDLDPQAGTAYYVGYVSLLLKDLATAKEKLAYMENWFAENKPEEPTVMITMLRGMIERYEAFPPTNVRDWHFVQYGTPLLRTSDEDLGPEAANSDLNGRYVFINYGFGNLGIVLETFRRLITEVPNMPTYQYIIPVSPNSAPLAFALSEMLGAPLMSPEALQSDAHGLVVAAWTDDVDRVAGHLADNSRVTLFSFALGWTMQANLAPDVLGYFDQAHRMPWEETVEIVDGTERRRREAIQETPEELSKRILTRLEELREEEKESIDAVIAYYKERAHLLRLGDNLTLPRMTFQTESPIESIRMFV